MNTFKFSNSFKVWYTIVSSIIAMLLPIILYFIAGSRPSLSSYVDTTLGNLVFSSTLLLVSHALTIRKLFTIPAVFLMFVVAFDCIHFSMIHNISAAAFFLSMGILMCIKKDLCAYGILMFLNIPTLFLAGLYWYEIISITLIILYNLHVLKKVYGRLKNTNLINEQ